jgi:hypothetical protein
MRLIFEDSDGTKVPELVLGAHVVHAVLPAIPLLSVCLLEADLTCRISSLQLSL